MFKCLLATVGYMISHMLLPAQIWNYLCNWATDCWEQKIQ